MLTYLYCYLSSFFQDEEGQGMAEYGLILVLVALVAVAGFTTLGGRVNDLVGGIEFAAGG